MCLNTDLSRILLFLPTKYNNVLVFRASCYLNVHIDIFLEASQWWYFTKLVILISSKDFILLGSVIGISFLPLLLLHLRDPSERVTNTPSWLEGGCRVATTELILSTAFLCSKCQPFFFFFLNGYYLKWGLGFRPLGIYTVTLRWHLIPFDVLSFRFTNLI